jgi:isoquinoline 1-oxidoreductase alpha subunit
MKLNVNGKVVEVASSDDTPLLWVLRDELGLTATKYGCGIAQCGNCVVHIDRIAYRSCITPLSEVGTRKVVTTEGLDGVVADEVRAAWLARNVVQCGYCQPAQILVAVSLLNQVKAPTDDDIDQAMAGVACRCGTYQRIRAAIHDAAKKIYAT